MIKFGRRTHVQYHQDGRKTESAEKYIWLSLPWKIWAYTIDNDDAIYCRPTFGIYWYKPVRWVTCLRWGWVYGPKSIGAPKGADC